MTKETTPIHLPPPRRPDRKSRGRGGVWMLWIFAALVTGLAAGVFIGKHLATGPQIVVQPPPDPGPAAPASAADDPDAPEILAKLAQAAAAINQGDWLGTRIFYQEILDQYPDHPVARAALPLIESHLATARGRVRVETTPKGALVKLGSLGEKEAPAVFEDVSFGVYPLEISRPGYQTIRRKITVDGPLTELTGINLARGTGELKLSSVPDGVEFKLLRTGKLEELVKIGKTPATIDQLDEGEYQVFMALRGWPDYREKIKVEPNRKASVSHIFARGGLKITSDPSDAEVWLSTDASLPAKKLGTTPLSASELPVGRHRLELRYRDWQPIQRTVEVRGGEAVELDFAWKRGAVTFRSDPVGATVLRQDKAVIGDGASKTPFTVEFPEGRHRFVAQYADLDPVMIEVDVKAGATEEAVFRFDYGSVSIASDPSGASVLMDGIPIGRTPFRREIVRPGPQSFDLTLAQHRSTTVSGEVMPGQSLNFNARLVYDPAPKTRNDFINSQGLTMVWIETLHGWVGAHEVTQKAFERLLNKNPSAFKGENLPVQGVTWYEATRFCALLTASERGTGALPKGYRYSLPSDQMWSLFAGSDGLDKAITSHGRRREGPARVGSLGKNEFGLYDVRGDVWEWCDDWYSLDIARRSREAGVSTNANWVGTYYKVLRGGSWNRSSDNDLAIGYRYALRPSTKENYEVGFRAVLIPE